MNVLLVVLGILIDIPEAFFFLLQKHILAELVSVCFIFFVIRDIVI